MFIFGCVGSSFPREGSLQLWQAGATPHRGARASPSWPLPLRSTGSAIVAHGPSRSPACGILPDQGPNPCPQHRQADSQPLRHQGSPRHILRKVIIGASLVAHCLRIRLPMQGTQVRALLREDPTCRGTTKPVCHNYWACVLQLLKPTLLELVLHNKRGHHNEKPAHHHKDWPPLATTRESPCAAMKTQCSQK